MNRRVSMFFFYAALGAAVLLSAARPVTAQFQWQPINFVQLTPIMLELFKSFATPLRFDLKTVQQMRSLQLHFKNFPTDIDSDGLTDQEEQQLGTSNIRFDTDDDGLSDYDEARVWRTDPLKPDTDCDSFSDGREVLKGYDPLTPASGFAGCSQTRPRGCAPQWQAGSWLPSPCVAETQQRMSYTDARNCGTIAGKPPDQTRQCPAAACGHSGQSCCADGIFSPNGGCAASLSCQSGLCQAATPPRCGDGITQYSRGEACDPPGSSLMCSTGYATCTASCTFSCPSPSCVSSWTCTPTGPCVNGSQPVSCQDANNCATPNPSAPMTQACAGGGCTPTTCSVQGKNCGTISNGCGGTIVCGACSGSFTCGGGGIPNVCGSGGGGGGCTPNWQTGPWGVCNKTTGLQTRTVTDANNCDITAGKPLNTQSCTVCGGLNLVCCPGNTCAGAGLICRINSGGTFICAACGGNGQPCCSTGSQCTGALTCRAFDSTCQQPIIASCGNTGEPCCAGNTCPGNSSLECKGGFCNVPGATCAVSDNCDEIAWGNCTVNNTQSKNCVRINSDCSTTPISKEQSCAQSDPCASCVRTWNAASVCGGNVGLPSGQVLQCASNERVYKENLSACSSSCVSSQFRCQADSSCTAPDDSCKSCAWKDGGQCGAAGGCPSVQRLQTRQCGASCPVFKQCVTDSRCG